MTESFQIGPKEDKESFLQLFALVLDEVYQEGSPFCVQQGTLLQWIHDPDPELSPTIEDLKAGLRGTPSGGHWPLAIVDARVWQEPLGGPFLRALKLAVETGPHFGVSSAPEICRILAAVAQTVGSADKKFKDENNKLYRERIDQAKYTYKKVQERPVATEANAANKRPTPSLTEPPVEGGSRDEGATARIPQTSWPPRILQVRVNKPENWPSMPVQDICGFLPNNRIALWHASNVGPRTLKSWRTRMRRSH